MAGLLIKNTSNILLRMIYFITMVVFTLYCGEANAVKLSTNVELIEIPKVTGNFEKVFFENEYDEAVVACSYTLPSSKAPPAVVRVTDINHNYMGIKLQQFESSADIEPGIVTCLIAEHGHNKLPDGRRIQTKQVLSTSTNGDLAPDGRDVTTMLNVSSIFQHFKNPIVFGQVMSYNDERASFFHANDCDAMENPPFETGVSDGMCVTKHIGQTSSDRKNEVLGIIVIEGGDGKYSGINYEVKLGGASVAGVGDNPPYNYSIGDTYDHALVIQSGMNGYHGSWAVSYGKPVNGSTLNLAVDEEVIEGDKTRIHTTEQIAYFVIRSSPVFSAAVEVDKTSIAEPTTLNYVIKITNTGSINQSGILVKSSLPDGSEGKLSAPSESMKEDGYLEVGEVWKYTVSYSVNQDEINKGAPLEMHIKATSDQYAGANLADELDLATTTITPAKPSIKVTKTADKTKEVAAGEIVTYTYVIENTGNQTIEKLTLSDAHNGSGKPPIPQNEKLTADKDINGDSSDGKSNDGVWEKLGPGDEVTFTATYTVTQTDLDTLQ